MTASARTPAAVVFDLGKVLVDFDYSIAGRRIAAQSDLPPAEVQHLIDHSPLLYRFETGLMSKHEFFEAVRAATGFRGRLEEFTSFFADIFFPMPAMIELHGQLRLRGVPTFIFSNTNELAIEHIRRNFPFFAEFTDYIFSYEHGAMKPDARLYEVVEHKAGRRGAEILYLDDRAENVEAGAKRGWQVVLQETPEKTWSAFRQYGFIPDSHGR
jgi:HAD superfamily hydrolase (TIGR01509 family)